MDGVNDGFGDNMNATNFSWRFLFWDVFVRGMHLFIYFM